MRPHGLWLGLAIVIASLVLGIGTTAILGAAGVFTRQGPYQTGPGGWGPGMMGPGMMGRYPGASPSCATPALPGTVVDITLADMGGMMGPGWNSRYGPGQNNNRWPGMGMMGMQRILVTPAAVPAGQVSFRAVNTGWLNHELVVLPLAQGQYPGQRVIGADGKVDEAGSVGEASRSCGADNGDGIAPEMKGWTTITLPPGRYELICNIAGHYGAGMYTELDVTANR